jgi:DNA-binding beta-propeller fold protein YncE
MRRYIVLSVLACALVAPQTAAAGGGPVVGGDVAGEGVTMPDLAYRWVAMRAGRHTLIVCIEQQTGRVDITRVVRKPLIVPSVAYDMSGTGLSADGTTLVLARDPVAYPRRRSAFVILDANTLQTRGRVTLRGDFALDAVSPDGGRLYLVQLKGPTRYVIRAYDVATRRLLPGTPVVGSPQARAVSPDGRWAYTLYDNYGAEFFIHALDTERGETRRIDLDGIAPDDLSVSRDGRLILSAGGHVVRSVDPHPAPLGLFGWFVRDNVRTYAAP